LKILRAAGWKDMDGDNILDKVIDGKKTKLSFTILEPGKDYVKYLTLFKENAKAAGVEVNIKVIEWNAFIKLMEERKFDALRLAWGGGSMQWDPKQVWHSSSIENKGSNFISYSNPTVDKLIDKARETMDDKKRIPILNEIYKTIAEDHPYVFLFYRGYELYFHSNKIQKQKETYKYGIGTSFWTPKAEI
jgi:ABC-type transport system substrate-binding protein